MVEVGFGTAASASTGLNEHVLPSIQNVVPLTKVVTNSNVDNLTTRVLQEFNEEDSDAVPIPVLPSCPLDNPNRLECLNGGFCKLGPTDFDLFSRFPDKPFAMNLHEADEDGLLGLNEMHCDCPAGFVGVYCEYSVQICDIDGELDGFDELACFNGGRCDSAVLNGKEQSVCKCDTEDGVEILGFGESCEHKVTAKCESEDESSTTFCSNHGKCAEPEFGSTPACECEPGFRGEHCEIVDEIKLPISTETTDTSTEAVSTKSNCPVDHELECENGGVCAIGQADFGPMGIQIERPPSIFFPGDASVNGMYCKCPKGFTGMKCETEVQTCGEDELFCFNGGVCTPRDITDEKQFECICQGDHMTLTTPAAGEACEHLLTSSCEINDKFSSTSFCTNGGKCVDMVNAGESHLGCECNEGFTGKHCELAVGTEAAGEYDRLFNTEHEFHDECPTLGKHRLLCHNGGVCRAGDKPPDLYDNLDEATNEWLNQHLAQTDTSNDAGMYCECPEGYTGNYCELQVAVCGENEHICFRGGACVENGLDSETEKYECDCGFALGQPITGKMCEFVADNNCDVIENFTGQSFCANGGICKNVGEGLTSHTGCVCPEGFKGDHCEIVEGLQFDTDVDDDDVEEKRPPKDTLSDSKPNPFDGIKDTEKKMNIVGLTFAVLAFVLIPVFLMAVRRSFRSTSNNDQARASVNYNIDPDGGNMPAPSSVENAAGDASSMEGMSQAEKDAAIV